MALHPCARCGRHVRRSERRCPFCSEALDELGAAPRRRRTLVAVALGLSTVSTAATGCDRVREMLPWVREERERANASIEPPTPDPPGRDMTPEQRAAAARAAQRAVDQLLRNEANTRASAMSSQGARYGAPPAPPFDEV